MFWFWFFIVIVLASIASTIGMLSSYYFYDASQFWPEAIKIAIGIIAAAISLAKIFIWTGHIRFKAMINRAFLDPNS